MATSGTVGSTIIDTALLIEHACRRAGIPASRQTPELVKAAGESLYMLLLGLANRGLNLWCVDHVYLGLVPGKATYAMPTGTIDILNVVFSKPSLLNTTETTTSTSTTEQLDADSTVLRVGVLFSSVTASDTLTIEVSDDSITWTTVATQVGSLVVGTPLWFNLDPVATTTYVRASTSSASSSTVYVVESVYDLPLTPWSRDTWAVMNNKTAQNSPSTNYYPEKLRTPQLTLWPVPNSNTDHLTVFRHRQIEDVGTLTQQLEIPQRWLEGITWEAALRIAVEEPTTPPDRLLLCQQMAASHVIEAEGDETDSTPIMLGPNLRGYTA